MKRTLLLICSFLICASLQSQSPFLKVIKDSLSQKNFGKVVFIDKDSLYVHVLFNSNYVIGGYCDGSNGSIYYLKLNKSNGQIIAYRSITSVLVMQASAACMYKGSIYLGGEMTSPFLDRSAVIIKFSTQTMNIVWQRNFNMKWYNAPADPNNPCRITSVGMTSDNAEVAFYGTAFCKPGFVPGQMSGFRGIIDTNNTSFNAMYYGAFASPVNAKFTNANGGSKAYVITHDYTTGNSQIVINPTNNQAWGYDQGSELNVVSTGHHYVGKFGKRVVYLVDKQSNSTCIIADSSNNVLVSKDFIGLHARALASNKNSAVLTFANDVGAGKGNEIIHVKIDSLLNFVAGKKMYLDTFTYSNFNCASSLDPNFTYCLFSKKSYSSSEVFIHKLNFTSLTCNEQYFVPLMSTVSPSTLYVAHSTTATVVQTTFSPYTFNKGLKDSLFCFAGQSQVPQANFTPSIICEGATFTFSGTATNTPTTWNWNMPGANNPSSNQQNPVNTYPLAGTYNVTLTVSNINGSSFVIKTVMVIPKPVIAAPSGSVCPGTSFTIQPTGASNYTYSGGSPVVSPIVTNTYSIIGEQNGCLSGSITCTVSVHSVAPLTLTAVKKTICKGESAILNASGASNYSSVPSGTFVGSQGTVTPSQSTTFSVTGIDANSCLTTSAIVITVSNCTGLEELKPSSISVYPSPADTYIVLEVGSVSGEIIFYNSLGAIVPIEPLETGISCRKFHTEKLPVGLYFVTIRSDDQLVRKSFVVNR